MEAFPINYLAVLVAAVVKSAIGMVWYAPAVFGTAWIKLAGLGQPSKKGMWRAVATDFAANFVMAFVLVHAIHYAGANSWTHGAIVGFFNWLGFIAAGTLGMVTFEKRPWNLYVINNGYQLASLLVMGAILAVWT